MILMDSISWTEIESRSGLTYLDHYECRPTLTMYFNGKGNVHTMNTTCTSMLCTAFSNHVQY